MQIETIFVSMVSLQSVTLLTATCSSTIKSEIFVAFSRQQCLRENATLLLFTHIAYLVSLCRTITYRKLIWLFSFLVPSPVYSVYYRIIRM